MKKFLSICIALLLCSGISAYEERNLLQKKVDIQTLKQSLIPNKGWVTYPNYNQRGEWDELIGDNKAYIIEQGEKYLDYTWQVVKATDYLEFSRSGDRRIMEKPLNDNLIAITSLMLAELAEGEGRFTDQLINGVFHSCEMTSWALSAHLINQKNHTPLPYHKEQLIDLVSGDASTLFSWIHYFFKDEFDKVNVTISERLRDEIKKRALDPYMEESNRFWWMALSENWGGFVNNWNPWCNSNVLLSFLLMEEDEDKLAEAVYKSMTSVDKFINYTKSDGACEEGPAYWGHAAGKMYDYLQVLSDATGGKVSIFDEPIIRNMGEYISRSYVGDGWVVNFADASAKMTMDYEHIYRYGKALGSSEMMEFAAYLKNKQPRKLSISRDLYRTLASFYSTKEVDKQKPVHTHAPYTWYPQTEFCYVSSGNVFFAAKGGYNDESHNHNDAGTFSLYIDDFPVFIDAGVGTYTRQTFSSERYSIWSMQSNYHSLPMINGYPQSYGKTYKASGTKFDKNKNIFSLDIANAYSKEAGVNKWTRSYKVEKSALQIEDAFDISNPQEVNQINFMTWGRVDISQLGVVHITVNGKMVQLNYDKNKFSPTIETKRLDDPRLSDIWGSEIYRLSLTAKNLTKKGSYKFTIKY